MGKRNLIKVRAKLKPNVSFGIKYVFCSIFHNSNLLICERGEDLIFFPANYGFSLQKYILLVHDLIGLRSDYPQLGFVRFMRYIYMGISLYFAKVVVTISATVKGQIINSFPFVSAEKVRVINNATDYKTWFENNLSNLRVDYDDYILCVANSMPHKGVAQLMEALINKIHPKILFVGEYDSAIKKYQSSQIVFLGRVTDCELATLYKKMLGMIVPSLEEGFSIPAAMCMSISKPLLLHDIPVFRELYGEYATFYKNEQQLSIALNEFHKRTINPVLYLKSWDVVSNQYYELFDETC